MTVNTKKDNLLNGGQFWRKHFFILSLLTLPLQIFASHIVGGEIGYRCLGGNEYEITLDLYRDCFFGRENAQFDDPASIGIFNLDDNSLFRDLRISFTVDDTLDAILNDPCLFIPDDVCVHTTTYRATVTLPDNDVGYKLVYQRCCRNETIANIEDPFNTGATYEIDLLPAAMQSCNSSPRFKSWPPIFICVNKPIFYDHSAADSEGDSLVYKLCTPNQGASFGSPQPQPPGGPPYDPVVFVSPTYNIDNLLGMGTPLRINPNTGRITGLPTLRGQFVVGVCVEEYRDGVLISETRRDFQYNVGLCGETQAVITAPAAQCDNLTVAFENNSTEADEFEWHFDYPNDPRATSTERNPTYTYPDTGRYTVMLIADPGSTCVDTSFTEVFLQTNSIDIDFEIEKADCSDSSVLGLIDFSTDTVSNIQDYLWEINYDDQTFTSTDANPVLDVPLNVQGTVTLTVTTTNGCTRTLTKSFQTGEEDPGSELPETIYVCFGDSVALNPDARELTSYNYTWTPGQFLDNATISNPTAYIEESTTFSVSVSPSNDLCSFEQTVTVVILDRPKLDFAATNSCDDNTVFFSNNSEHANNYRWDFGDETTTQDTATTRDAAYTYPDLGTYEVTLIADTIGFCADTIVQTVTVSERSLSAAISVDYTDCSTTGISVQFSDVSTNSLEGNTVSRDWVFSTGATSTEAQPVLTVTEAQSITATLTITTTADCTATTIDTFEITPIQIEEMESFVTVCSGSPVALYPSADPDYTYQWSPTTGLDDPMAANPMATPDTTTTYTVTITNVSADTCSISRTVTVSVAARPDLSVNEDVSTCDAEATIFATSTDATIIEYLDDTGSVLGSGSNSFTVPVSGSRIYRVRAIGANGCHTIRPITVSGGPTDIAIVGENALAFCAGETVRLNVENKDPNDSLTYRWEPASEIISDANTAQPTIRSTVGERTFFVTATNQYDCATSDSVQVVVVDTSFLLGFDAALQCDGQTVKFNNTSTNAFGYFWNFGDGRGTSTEQDPTYVYDAPGIYEVYLTLGYDIDCTDTLRQQIEIFEPTISPAFAFNYVNCEAGSTVVQFDDQTTTNITNGLTYNWRFGNEITTNERNPRITLDRSQALDVEFCVTSSNGCQSCISDTLNISTIEFEIQEEQSICVGESVALNPDGNPTHTYFWSPATGLDDPTAANPIASPATTTTYTVTVQHISADTCQLVRMVTVDVADEIGLNVETDDNTNQVTTCGENAVLTATTTTSGANFEWTDEQGNVISQGAVLEVSSGDTAVYYVTAMLNGCVESDSIIVINNGIDTDISIAGGGTPNGNNQVCEGEELQLSVINNRPEQTLTYNWTANAQGTIVNGETTDMPTVAVSGTGRAVFYLTITNELDCTFRDSVVVDVIPFRPDLDGEVTACAGVATSLNPNGNTDYQYTWSPNTGLDDPNIANPTAILTENQDYTVRIQNGDCTTEMTVSVVVAPAVGLAVPMDTTVCTAGGLTLSAKTDKDATYTWSLTSDFTDVLSTDAILDLDNIQSGTYFVRATGITSECVETDSVRVTDGRIELELAPAFDLCLSDELQLVTTNARPEQELSYFWSPTDQIISGANTSAPTVSPDSNTVYTVEVENQFGCFATLDTRVTVINLEGLVDVKAEPNSIVLGQSAQLSATLITGADYNWTPAATLDVPDSFAPIATPDVTTTYQLNVDVNGCVISRDVEVTVLNPQCEFPFIFVPNAFTPNDDKENDYFRVYGSAIEEMTLIVYNRWGQKVFESTDPQQGWDGTFNGERLPPDAFGYYLTVKCIGGQEYTTKGNVNLLR